MFEKNNSDKEYSIDEIVKCYHMLIKHLHKLQDIVKLEYMILNWGY